MARKNSCGLDIDHSILNSFDKVLVQDLVVAAINKALDEVEVKSKEELRKARREYCEYSRVLTLPE